MTFIDYHLDNPIPSERFQTVYDLLESSFPQYERRTKEKQYSLVTNPNYHILAIMDNEMFIGFLTFWNFDDFLYVEHFATNPIYRNKGIGHEALKYLDDVNIKPVFLEIEPPNDEMTARRQKFYEKNGYTTHTFEYAQPPFHIEDEYTPLLIMSKNVEIDENSFFEYKKVLFSYVYNIIL